MERPGYLQEFTRPQPRRPASLALPENRVHVDKKAPAAKTKTASLHVEKPASQPRVKAKAMFCVDRSSNRVVFRENESAPLPIASITKLLTAMVVIDQMDLNEVVETPADILEVPKHTVGIRPGDLFTVKDLLHGMLIESGNDCAEALAESLSKGRQASVY